MKENSFCLGRPVQTELAEQTLYCQKYGGDAGDFNFKLRTRHTLLLRHACAICRESGIDDRSRVERVESGSPGGRRQWPGGAYLTQLGPDPTFDYGRRRTLADVRYWHLADMPFCAAHVRFSGQSGHGVLHRKCLLLTQSGHCFLVRHASIKVRQR